MIGSRPFKMTMSLDVLRHLRIGLYSKVRAVLSELVVSAWDADATEFEITLDNESASITVQDDGHGMSQRAVYENLLTVDDRRRLTHSKTLGRRDATGRKGIAKLAAFSIEGTVEVHTADGRTASLFRMNTEAIKLSEAEVH